MYNIGLFRSDFRIQLIFFLAEPVEEEASLIRKVLHCKISIKA